MVSGIKAVIAQAEDEVDFSVDEDEDEHADGDEDDDDDEGEREEPGDYKDAETEEDNSSEDEGDSSEDEGRSEDNSSEGETETWAWARFAVHLTRDDLPKMRKTTPMNTPGDFNKFMFRFKQAMKFPGSEWFGPAWGAVARSYRRKGEGRWLDAVEKNVLNPSKSGACFMGWAALGQPTHTNSLETGNRWLKKEIREWLQIESPAAVLPTSLTLIVDALADLWPKWSADDAKRGHYHAPSKDDLGSQKKFRSQLGVKGSLVLRLNGDAGEKSCLAFDRKPRWVLCTKSA